MFATHYHELTELAENLPGAKNYQVLATEKDGEIVFLHKLKSGKASKSYGIAVAQTRRTAPRRRLPRAKTVLAKLEQYEMAVFAETKRTPDALDIAAGRASSGKMAAQFSLFAISNESVVDELRELKINNFSDREAKEFLEDLQKRIV